MSSPASAVLDRLAPPAPTTRDATSARARPWRLLLLGCLALATLSLLAPSVPTYDPWAWIIWGREILHGDLVTTTGPSWKPLPVLFTTPFSLLGDDGAPLAWIAIARAGGLLAFAFAYRLGARLAGPIAGAIAAAALFLADDFIFDFARGNSEGVLVALCLWAIERHLDGRRRDAFLLGLGAALLRPEVWPFIALYGLFLLWRERTRGTLALVLGGGVALALLWFVPEYLGSGDFLRAAARARQPIPTALTFAKFPFLAVFGHSAAILTPPVYFGAAVAVLLARRPLYVAMGAIGTVLMASVALMTQFGFAGNLRYVALPAALVCVLAGAGWVWLIRAAHAHYGRVAAAALMLLAAGLFFPFVRDDVNELRANATQLERESDLYGSVPGAIRAGGGAAKLKSCGTVYTGPFQTQTVAWYLHLHETQVEIFAYPPGTVIAPGYTSLSKDPRFPAYARTAHWVIGSSCPR
jgi:hypothetical protein